jgi:general secretion pathway protein K
VLLLLSALAATTVYISRTNAILVRRSFQLAQAQAAADAAVIYTLSNLSDEQVSRHGPIDGTAGSWQFNGVDVTIAVTNEAGRIDVNAADDDLIYAFLMSQGVAEDDGKTLLKDLRNRQQIPDKEIGTTMSASSSAPVVRGSSVKYQLQTIDELAQIASWRSQPLGCWANTLTVYSGSPNINITSAVDPAMSALKWAEAHHLGGRQWTLPTSASAQSNDRRAVIGDVLRIETRAKISDDVGAGTEWVGRLTGNSNAPALTMRWARAMRSLDGTCRAPDA